MVDKGNIEFTNQVSNPSRLAQCKRRAIRHALTSVLLLRSEIPLGLGRKVRDDLPFVTFNQ